MMRYVAKIILVLCLAVLITGCRTYVQLEPVQADGKVCGKLKGYRFWNYYEAALSFVDCEQYQQAAAYFLQAIELRDVDKQRVRTTGLDFTDWGYPFFGYYPHRELGIVYYKLGRIEPAKIELEKSIASEVSQRAHYYLDQVRKEWIFNRDHQNPEIFVKGSEAVMLTNALSAVIIGTARDDTYVRQVWVGGKEYRMPVSEKETEFEVEVPLAPGENRIPVVVKDLSGKENTRYVTVYCDRSGPVVNIVRPGKGETVKGNQIAIAGTVTDDVGLKEIKVHNNQPVQCNGRKTYPIDGLVSLKSNEGRVIILVKDTAGNETPVEIDLSGRSLLTEGPPVITMQDGKNAWSTFNDQIMLEGKVLDNDGIRQVHVNGKPVLDHPSSGVRVYFNCPVVLKKDQENTIRVEAVDNNGNAHTEMVRIMQTDLKVQKRPGGRLGMHTSYFIGARMRFSEDVKNFMVSDPEIGHRADTALFASMHSEQAPRFSVSQKGKQWKKESDRAEEVAKRIKQGGAKDCVLFGRAWRWKDGVNIRTEIVDVETLEVLTIAERYGENVSPEKLKQMCDGIYLDLKEEFPLADGMVIRVKRDRIHTNIGENRVKKNIKLYVCSTDALSGGTGAQMMDQAWIKYIYDDGCDAELMMRAKRMGIKEGDYVITK